MHKALWVGSAVLVTLACGDEPAAEAGSQAAQPPAAEGEVARDGDVTEAQDGADFDGGFPEFPGEFVVSCPTP